MASLRRRRPVSPPFTTLDDIPLRPTTHDMSRIYQKSVQTILRHVRAGTFRPMPIPGVYPYQWNKADVLRDLGYAGLGYQPSASNRLKLAL